MACNACEIGFQSAQSIVTSIEKTGTTALLYLKNQGRNIVLLKRIVLCSTAGKMGTTTLYLRPAPDSISWSYPSECLEPNITALFYTWNNISSGSIVQAQAEYVELEGRSLSCPINF